MRLPPAPANTLIAPPGAFTNVPLVTVSVEPADAPLVTINSIVPLFVNPLATVRLAVNAAPSTRNVDPADVLNGPFRFVVCIARNKPSFETGALIVQLVRETMPAFVSSPDPFNVLLLMLSRPLACTDETLPSVSVRFAAESVCVPLAAPSSSDATDALTSSVTV